MRCFCLILGLFSSSSFAFAPNPPKYACTLVTQYKEYVSKSFDVPADKGKAQFEFTNPKNGAKQRADFTILDGSLRLALMVETNGQWESIARNLIGGYPRSVMLEDPDKTFLTCAIQTGK